MRYKANSIYIIIDWKDYHCACIVKWEIFLKIQVYTKAVEGF